MCVHGARLALQRRQVEPPGFAAGRRLLSSLTVIDIGGRDVASQAARNVRRLRGLGLTVRKTIDTLVATRCILDAHAPLFSDRDFEPFEEHLGLVSAIENEDPRPRFRLAVQ